MDHINHKIKSMRLDKPTNAWIRKINKNNIIILVILKKKTMFHYKLDNRTKRR